MCEAECSVQVSQGRLDIAAEGQTVGQAAASPQPQAIFKTGEAAKEVRPPFPALKHPTLLCSAACLLAMHHLNVGL